MNLRKVIKDQFLLTPHTMLMGFGVIWIKKGYQNFQNYNNEISALHLTGVAVVVFLYFIWLELRRMNKDKEV